MRKTKVSNSQTIELAGIMKIIQDGPP